MACFAKSVLSVLALTVGGSHLLVSAAELSYPGKEWVRATPAEMGLDEARLNQARDYALTGGGSGCVVRRGKLVMSWGDFHERYDLKSTTKSIGVTALGLAIQDGKMQLSDLAAKHHPGLGTPPESNAGTGWIEKITLFHLASQTAGFDKPGGYAPLLFAPGTKWSYSDGGPNWLAECVTRVYRQDVNTLLFERVFRPLGIGEQDLVWRKNSYRPHEIEGVARREFGSGVSANVNAMARLGCLYLAGGLWQGRQILPRSFVDQARTAPPQVVGLPVVRPEVYGKASNHYGLLWWNNADGTLYDVPRDAYWAHGLGDSLIIVMPSLDLVAARAGKAWRRQEGADHYDVLKPFLGPLAQSCRPAQPAGNVRPPYPPSSVIRELRWATPDTIIRKARGSDNWPLTLVRSSCPCCARR